MNAHSKNILKIVALIPVRGGSKSIPAKNIRDFAGKPLVYWTILAAQLTEKIEKVYVPTDCPNIKEVVESFNLSKVEVIGRSPETATDIASTESVMLEFADKVNFQTLVLIQATSPLLTSTDLTNAIEQYQTGSYDSMLSVVRQRRFLWNNDRKKGALPLNYDYKARPRRQDFEGYWVENGAFYITERQALLHTRNRLNGHIGLYEMPEYNYLELDEEGDWAILESLAKRIETFHTTHLTRPIKVVILDVDGVLTDGSVYCSGSGEELLKFSRVDGKGIELLKQKKLDVWVVSAENSPIAGTRCDKLGITKAFWGVKDKLKCVQELSQSLRLCREELCFIGDDIQDIPVMEWVGFSAAPRNAVQTVKLKAHYVCANHGGRGAVREVIDLILTAKGNK
jgi:YrbI family 3-deoxy-D-manno-octulosonate 8-phosphate phosphatase